MTTCAHSRPKIPHQFSVSKVNCKFPSYRLAVRSRPVRFLVEMGWNERNVTIAVDLKTVFHWVAEDNLAASRRFDSSNATEVWIGCENYRPATSTKKSWCENRQFTSHASERVRAPWLQTDATPFCNSLQRRSTHSHLRNSKMSDPGPHQGMATYLYMLVASCYIMYFVHISIIATPKGEDKALGNWLRRQEAHASFVVERSFPFPCASLI